MGFSSPIRLSVLVGGMLIALGSLCSAGCGSSQPSDPSRSGDEKSQGKGNDKTAGKVNPKVTKANFDLIRPGMTQADVEALFGPGKELNGNDPLITASARRPDRRCVMWAPDPSRANFECFLVAFTPDGKMNAQIHRKAG